MTRQCRLALPRLQVEVPTGRLGPGSLSGVCPAPSAVPGRGRGRGPPPSECGRCLRGSYPGGHERLPGRSLAGVGPAFRLPGGPRRKRQAGKGLRGASGPRSWLLQGLVRAARQVRGCFRGPEPPRPVSGGKRLSDLPHASTSRPLIPGTLAHANETPSPPVPAPFLLIALAAPGLPALPQDRRLDGVPQAPHRSAHPSTVGSEGVTRGQGSPDSAEPCRLSHSFALPALAPRHRVYPPGAGALRPAQSD